MRKVESNILFKRLCQHHPPLLLRQVTRKAQYREYIFRLNKTNTFLELSYVISHNYFSTKSYLLRTLPQTFKYIHKSVTTELCVFIMGPHLCRCFDFIV